MSALAIAKCPCCGKAPSIRQIHREILVECCEELDRWAERHMDLPITYTMTDAISQWNAACLGYVADPANRRAA